MTAEQAKGTLYEIVISHFLEKNNFIKCQKSNPANKHYKCGVISEKGEIRGRGTKHQIDFVGVYQKHIPFVYPIRVLVECKFWTNPVDKSFIREYIGVYKDISENYFSLYMKKSEFTRFLDIPIIFSANGFDNESEKLAWAQGINLVSHSKIPLLRDILDFINFLIDNSPSNIYEDKEIFKEFKIAIEHVIKNTIPPTERMRTVFKNIYRNIERHFIYSGVAIDKFIENLNALRDKSYQTFLFASTNNGKLLNLISYDEFPDDLFRETNEQNCAIYYDQSIEENTQNNLTRVFYISFPEDDRKFYFEANKSLMRGSFSDLPVRDRIIEKMKYFSSLNIIKEIDGLTRLITLKVDFSEVLSDID